MPQLPGYNIGNALLDFSPVSNALQSYQKNALAQQQLGMDQQRLDMDRQSHDLQKQNLQRQWSQQDAERAGNEAFAIQNMQGPAKGIAWQRYLKTYGDGDHTPEELDPNTGPAIAAAHAGKYIDSMKQQMQQLEMQKTRAEIGVLNQKAAAGPGALDANQRVGAEHNLRKEYSQIAKPYFDVRDAYARVEQSAKAPSAAGDLALLFNYMKMLDPGSVVREGEFATAQNAAGLPDQIRNMYNRVVSGERLNENQRGDFVNQSRGLMDTQERQYKAIQNQYGEIAKRSGVDARNVIIDFSQPQAAPSLSFPLNAPVPKGTYKWNPDSGDIR